VLQIADDVTNLFVSIWHFLQSNPSMRRYERGGTYKEGTRGKREEGRSRCLEEELLSLADDP